MSKGAAESKDSGESKGVKVDGASNSASVASSETEDEPKLRVPFDQLIKGF